MKVRLLWRLSGPEMVEPPAKNVISGIMLVIRLEIRKYGSMGEKTGWTYVEFSEELAQQLYPGNRKSFRIRGKLDAMPVKALALIPVGEGRFILPLNGEMRKKLKKQLGQSLTLQVERDDNPDPIPMPTDFAECLADEPKARQHFDGLPGSHQKYYIKWIDSAKTEPTRVKRIAQAVTALAKAQDYGEMIRSLKNSA